MTSERDSKLPYLPVSTRLHKTNENVIIERFREEDAEDLFKILESVVEEGLTFPSLKLDQSYFRDFHLCGDPFVLKLKDNGELIGYFRIRQMFPGRSAHICCGGFAVKSSHRGKGTLQVMIKAYLKFAKDLGYSASLFTLVYANNTAAIHVYKKIGFTQIGAIPNAGNVEGIGLVDALQFYYDLTTLDQDGVPQGGWPK